MVGNLGPDLPDFLVLLFLLRGWEGVGRNGRNGRNDEKAGMVSKKEGNRHGQVFPRRGATTVYSQMHRERGTNSLYTLEESVRTERDCSTEGWAFFPMFGDVFG